MERELKNSTTSISLIYGIIWVINNYYVNFSTAPLTIAQYAASERSLWYHNDLINDLLKHYALNEIQSKININAFLLESFNEKQSNVQLLNVDGNEYVYSKNYERKNKAIWFIDSLATFRFLLKDLLNKQKYYDRNGYFIIIYTGDEADPLQNVQTIYDELFHVYSLNVNVFLPGPLTHVYTFFPFQPDVCNYTRPQLLYVFTENEIIPANIAVFPKKAHNLYGCKVYLTTWNDDPFVIVEKNETTGELLRLHGIEGSLMTLISRRMNFSIVIKNPVKKERGEIYANGTLTGAVQLIHDGESNITMNSYIYNERRAQVMLPTYSHMSCSLALAVPHGKSMKSWQRLIKPFGTTTWILTITCIILVLLFVITLKIWANTRTIAFLLGQRNTTPAYNILSTLYGGVAQSPLPSRNFARFLLVAWLLLTFVMRSAYISELYYILNDGSDKLNLQTIADVVRQNYTFYAAPVQEQMLRDTTTENIKVVTSNIFPTVFKEIQLPAARFVIVALEPTINLYNKFAKHTGGHINILPERLNTNPIVFFLRKHSYLKHEIDHIVRSCFAAGVIDEFENVYLYKDLRFHKEHVAIPLSFDVLEDLFKLFLFLMTCCILVFCLELLSVRYSILHKIINFFNI